jgi:DDE superfamily endonuclease
MSGLDVGGDLPPQVAVSDGRRHVGDIAHLTGQVPGHKVDVVGDGAYGDITEFRCGLQRRELAYVVDAKGATSAYGAQMQRERLDWKGNGRPTKGALPAGSKLCSKASRSPPASRPR